MQFRQSLRARILAVLLQTKRAEVPWRVLLRNTAAVILPLALGIASGRVGVGLWISVGAIVTLYSDQPGPYRQRLARLLAVSAAGGGAAFIGMVLGGNLPAILAAMAVIGFGGALLVVFGDAAGRVGMAAMILLAITSADPASSGWIALQSAALIACGGVLLTLLSVAAWPLQRYGPEREALAAVYRGLAALARQHDAEAGTAPALSAGMTGLQHTLLGPHRARGPVMDTFGVLLELAERIRLELTALAGSDPEQGIARLIRTETATLLEDIGNAIAGGADAAQTMARSLESLRAPEAGSPTNDAALDRASVRHFHALAGQLAAAVRNAGRATAAGALRAAEQDLQLPSAVRPQSPAALLLASLTPRSAAFRHAVRTAMCFTAAACLGRLLDLSHGYWIPMTVAIVLRADYGSTFSYGLLRVAGTVMGLVLTTGLLHFLPPGSWERLAVMAVLCAAFRYFGAVNYGVAVTALTGMVVLLLALAGEPAEPTMISRLIGTVIGSAMALTAYGLWPTREREQIRTSLSRLLGAYAAYLGSLRAGEADERRDARNSARVARANAEAALARLLAEPQACAAHAELAQSLLTNSNRLARTTMTLEAALGARGASAAGTGSPGTESPGGSITALIHQGAASLRQISKAVANDTGAECISPRLRATERGLVRKMSAGERGAGGELAMLSDRLVDNINT
ncbi:MAG: FUSC family protein, partial [Steroidobacteraceae bacterium]